MTIRLRDLIKQVRACKTAAEEREIIQKESANIRTSFKNDDSENRHRNMAKLLYIQMLGYSTHWGQMETLKLIASNSYSDKRIGYLGLMLLLDEKQELLTLVTNHMKNDLNNNNPFVAGLALCALGNISSPGMARDLAPEVEKLLSSSNAYLRKKAALCAIRILRKCPDLMENFVPRIRALLSDRNHGVLLTGIELMIELCEMDSHNIEFFRRLVSTLVRILKNLVMSGYAPEYDVSGITDPFLQVKILRLLCILGKGNQESSDIMNDILAQVATNTDHTRNVGNAILYECVQTIMSIESEDGLRLLAINVLGRFLSNKDNNIRYVALSTLGKVVNADIEAVQRHRSTIVDCLKDPDVSIRHRALDLIYALVNENNIKVLAIELLNFLQTASSEFRADLAVKLCNVTEKYSPNKRWQIDTLLKILSIAGNFVPEEVPANLIGLIASSPDIHSYAVQKMYLALTNDISQQTLTQVAVWTIGEFGDILINPVSEKEVTVNENDVIDLFTKILRSSISNLITKEFTITASMKLTTRFSNQNSIEKLHQLIKQFDSNIEVELQQRSVEYDRLFKWDNIRKNLFERMPVLEQQQQTEQVATTIKEPTTASTNKESGNTANDLIGLLDNNLGVSSSSTSSKPTNTGNTLDILNDIFGSQPVITSVSTSASSSSIDLLGSLESSNTTVNNISSNSTANITSNSVINPPATASSISPVINSTPITTSPIINSSTTSPMMPTNKVPLNGALPTMTVFQKGGLTILFDLMKQSSHPNITVINISFLNQSTNLFSNFEFKAAVPKYIKLQVNPPSANSIPSNGKVTQQIKLMNTLHGEKPLLLKIKIDYVINGSAISEISDVTFPEGV